MSANRPAASSHLHTIDGQDVIDMNKQEIFAVHIDLSPDFLVEQHPVADFHPGRGLSVAMPDRE